MSSTEIAKSTPNRSVCLWLTGIVCLLGLLPGCSETTMVTTYGALEYPEKNSSVNGLGVVEKLCLQSGMRVMHVSRLSPRLRRVDCLVLIGDCNQPPASEARDWIEDWLADNPGRTVIYFGRDFTAEAYVYERTMAQQPAAKQARAKVDLARIHAQLDAKLYSEIGEDVFCRWFVLRASKPARQITKFNGPLSELMGDGTSWPVRAYFDVPDEAQRDTPPTWRTSVMTPAVRFPAPPPRKKNTDDDKPSVFTSYWTYTDINDDETWDAEWDKTCDTEVLLGGADGTPLVTKLTSERFEGSQIWLLANGAPMLNGSLVEPSFMRLANHLVGQLPSEGRVAFLPFNYGGIQVSEVPDDGDGIAGLSVLVTWPLNILMAHLTVLGILICLALFPIHGRPQKLPAQAVSDFGQHAEALGQMLSRSRDIEFAAQLSADYLRLVRGESLPQWLQSASTTTSPTNVTTTTTPTPASDSPVSPRS